MSKTAVAGQSENWEHVRDISEDYNGEAHLIELPGSVDVLDWDGNVKVTVSHIVVSATHVPVVGGIETYAFPAEPDGDVVDWGELPGSAKGTLDWVDVADRVVSNIRDGQLGRCLL